VDAAKCTAVGVSVRGEFVLFSATNGFVMDQKGECVGKVVDETGELFCEDEFVTASLREPGERTGVRCDINFWHN
jgi:hypothetical protein